MADFSPVIADFWLPQPVVGEVIHQDETFTIIVNPDLAEDRRLTILTTATGQVTVKLTPGMAEQLGVRTAPNVTEATFRQALTDSGATLHDPNCLLYFTATSKAALLDEGMPATVRQLTESDEALFKAFESAATAEDLDEAYVELDHWAVFGSFEGDRLVAAASTYPWGGAKIADIGVLTLPAYRGKGHGRAVVRAISRHAYGEGYEPQYRCQPDNHGSRALAASAGCALFGMWEVIETTARASALAEVDVALVLGVLLDRFGGLLDFRLHPTSQGPR